MTAIINSTVNAYSSSTETDLVQSLVDESLQQKGLIVNYLPRTLVNEDTIFGEDTSSTFNSSVEIEMLLKDAEGSGDDFATRFGLDIQDRITLTVSKARCATEGITPAEGDLIYFPLQGTIYEILYVEDESLGYYMLGNQYSYDLICQLFEYGGEDFDTGNTTIDAIETSQAYKIQIPGTLDSGTFTVGETVYQGANIASATMTAELTLANSSILEVINVTGTIAASTNVTGNTSSAVWTYTTGVDTMENVNETQDKNVDFESQGNTIVDSTESSPWAGLFD